MSQVEESAYGFFAKGKRLNFSSSGDEVRRVRLYV